MGDVPLKYLFRGHAPLGMRFAGPEAKQKAMEEMLKIALRPPVKYCDDDVKVAVEDLEDTRTRRADYVAAQARYHAADAVRRQQQRQRPSRSFHRFSRFRRIGRAKRQRSSKVTQADTEASTGQEVEILMAMEHEEREAVLEQRLR